MFTYILRSKRCLPPSRVKSIHLCRAKASKALFGKELFGKVSSPPFLRPDLARETPRKRKKKNSPREGDERGGRNEPSTTLVFSGSWNTFALSCVDWTAWIVQLERFRKGKHESKAGWTPARFLIPAKLRSARRHHANLSSCLVNQSDLPSAGARVSPLGEEKKEFSLPNRNRRK